MCVLRMCVCVCVHLRVWCVPALLLGLLLDPTYMRHAYGTPNSLNLTDTMAAYQSGKLKEMLAGVGISI